jgi:ribosomal protein S18 acetylase RimI-like enzyme
VRTARADDAAAILNLWSLARGASASTADPPATIERLLARDPGALLVAHLDAMIVGTAIATWDGWRGHIYRVAVTPERRRQGMGRLLVTAAQARLRTLGATKVNVAVDEHDPGSIAFWLAVGYRRDRGMSRFAKAL